MRTNYHTDQRPAYECSSRARPADHARPAGRCAAATVDDAVAGALLDALTPEQVALALAAAGEVTGRHQRVSRAAELAVERARYDADRAERAFCLRAGEPAGRPHPGSPLGSQARRPRRGRAGPGGRPRRAAAAARPGRAWRNSPPTCPHSGTHPATSSKDRKRLLRTLIADVTLLPEPDQAKVRIGIRWHTGATDELTVARPLPPRPGQAQPVPGRGDGPPPRPRHATAELAGQLNAAGLTTGHGRPFDVKAVQWIRHAYHIPAPAPTPPARSASPRPPAGWAAAPASSTTGSTPGS